MSTFDDRLKIAKKIVDFGASRDIDNHLQMNPAPAGDGAGKFDVAGVDVAGHPAEATRLRELVEARRYAEAETEACQTVAHLTDAAQTWTSSTAVEAFLRDTILHRGQAGGAHIFQMALGVKVDGFVGPITLKKAESIVPADFLKTLRQSRESYERDTMKGNETDASWPGLVRRWDDSLAFAESFLDGNPSNFYRDVICKDPRFESAQRIDDVALLEPGTRAAVAAIMEEAKAGGIDLMVFETYRSQARQEELYKKGATQWKTVGVHHYGLACDLVKSVRGQPSWKGSFSFLQALCEKHKLIWGGDWGGGEGPHPRLDDDHVQRIKVLREAELFSGSWYPDETFDPYA